MAGTTITTAYGGSIRSAIVGQQLSGHGGDLVIVDDPLSPSHARDDAIRGEVNSWHQAEVVQRLNSRADSAFVLVMQRVHYSDLTHHLLVRNEGFQQLELPGVATSNEEWLLADGRHFTRARGEALAPNRETVEQQFALFQEIGPYAYATQYLQNSCGTEDERVTMKWGPKPLDWSPEKAHIPGGFRGVTLAQRVKHYAFGCPLPEHASWKPVYPLTREEWQAAATLHSRRLMATHQ